MPTYTAPTQDQVFVLDDVLRVSAASIPGYEDLDRDTLGAILDEAAKLEEVLNNSVIVPAMGLKPSPSGEPFRFYHFLLELGNGTLSSGCSHSV